MSTAAFDGTRAATSPRSAWPMRPRSRGTLARSARQRHGTIAADSPPRMTESTARPTLPAEPSNGGRAGPVARSAGRGGGTARRAGREARFRRLAAREPSRLGRAVAGTDRAGWGGSPLAGDHGCERLLPPQLDPLRIAGQHVTVRARVLADLSLLPRACDVGHRDVHGAAAAPARAPCGPRPAGLSLSAPERGTPQRRPAWLARSHVSLGELPAARGGVDSWRPAVHRGSRQRGHRPGLRWRTSMSPATGTMPAGSRGPCSAPSPSSSCHASFDTKRGYEILGTVGPREVYASVDNNAYTNMSSALALEAAVDCAPDDRRARAGALEPDRRRLVVPRDRRRGAIINHEGARLSELQGGVPEGAAGLFPLGYQTDRGPSWRPIDTRRSSRPLCMLARRCSAPFFLFTRPAPGSQPSPAVAREWIWRLHQRALPGARRVPSVPTRPAPSISDVRQSERVLTGLLYGFTGLRPSPGEPATWGAHAAALPQGWHAIEVERVWIRRRAYALHARPGAVVTLAASD